MGQSLPSCCGANGRLVESTGLTPRPGLVAQAAGSAETPHIAPLKLPSWPEEEASEHSAAGALKDDVRQKEGGRSVALTRNLSSLSTPSRLRVARSDENKAAVDIPTSALSVDLDGASSETSDGASQVDAGDLGFVAATEPGPEGLSEPSRIPLRPGLVLSEQAGDLASMEISAVGTPPYSHTNLGKGEEGKKTFHEDDDSDPGAEVDAALVSALFDPAVHPSRGSALHAQDMCKRCCFFPRGRCLNGKDCVFCHYEHEKRKRKSKSARRAAALAALGAEGHSQDDPLGEAAAESQASGESHSRPANSGANHLDAAALPFEPQGVQTSDEKLWCSEMEEARRALQATTAAAQQAMLEAEQLRQQLGQRDHVIQQLQREQHCASNLQLVPFPCQEQYVVLGDPGVISGDMPFMQCMLPEPLPAQLYSQAQQTQQVHWEALPAPR